MDPTTILNAALSAVAEISARLTGLIGALPDATAPIRPGTWSVREAAVHLVVEAEGCIELARGAPAPYVYSGAEEFNAEGGARLVDIPEADPPKLAGLITDVTERLVATATGRPGEQPVDLWGTPSDLSRLIGIELGELVLHGYDIASAVGQPWPIDPISAQLALYGYAPCFAMCVNQDSAAGHTAGYLIELRGGESLVVRFTDGQFSLEPPGGGPVDCVLSVDPVAFLLLGFGRISLWETIALGLVSTGGDRPELGLGYFDLFDVP